ncbi:hypothetical protein Cgig2_021443 [Carnegiea gigantea]|uniref:BRCT domain-containing protein n=1 Tax=Carnegiea gigantea TaxID=171969 RepID=A0A9Q1QA18_9CARY|nr:hypothetical protein Cgig2_021443 [Carnegiea gigantea]
MAAHSDIPIFGNKFSGTKEVYVERFDSVAEVNGSLIETPVGAVQHDTEVLHDVDSTESLESLLLDGYDTQVVPDSDDEVTDAAEKKGFSCRSDDFVDSSPPSFSPCKKQRCPIAYIAACAGSGHVSGQSAYMIVCKGNDDCPVTVQSEVQGTEVYFEDSGISQVKDADLVSAISCAVFTDDSRQLSEGVKFDHYVETSQWKKREVHIVYTRKKKRTSCTLREMIEQEGTRAPNTKCECAGLSYVDSQEPEDLAKALLFVDEYVSVNAVDSSPVANVNVRDRSPPMSSANGVQSLVRWAKLRDKAEEAGIFDWDQCQDTVGKSDCLGNRGQLSFLGNKHGKIFVRRSSDLKDVISKKHGKPDIFSDGKAGSFNSNQSLKDLTHSHPNLAVCDSETSGETKKGNEKRARELSDAELDLQGNGERPITQLELGAVHKESDSEHNFDVGIDTQIAAEAIQELSLGASAGSIDKDADQCPKSVGGTEKKNDAGVWPFPKKARSASRSIASQPIDNRRFLCSDSKRKGVQILELEGRENGKKLSGKCLAERSSEDSGKAKSIKKTKIKGAKGANSNGFKEKLSSFVANEDLSLCKLKHRRKQRDIYPLGGSLKSPNLLNMNGGLKNESMEGMIDHMKVGFHDKRIETSANDDTLEVSAQMENHSELLWEKSRNNGNVYVSKEGKTYPIIYEPAINTSDGKLHQLEFDLHGKGNEGSIGANMLGVSSLMENFSKSPSSKFKNAGKFKITHDSKSYAVALKGWFSRDYSKGKRICTRMLCHSEGSSGVDYSAVKFRTERCDHSSLRSQCNSESLLSSISFGSNVKRRRRSSVYISPCWYSPEKNRNVNFHNYSVDVSRQKQISDSDPVVETQRISEQLMDDGSAVKLEEASKDFAGTVNGAKRIDDQGLAYKTVNSHALNPVMSPNYPPLTDETNLINMIDGCREQGGKKKATLSPLPRELVRLGLNESISEFTSKDFRKRKTMANIRVLLSQNLDKGILKQQKKILARLGVPVVSCPSAATHFIADKFARTRNMLEFIAHGKHVVTHMWLESCDQAGSFIDERNYILGDVKKEQEIGFKLSLSLDQARQHPLLKGYRVFVTPSVQPGQELLTSLVSPAHGQSLYVNIARSSGHNSISIEVAALRGGVMAYNPELILNGIIIQKLEFERLHRN